MSPTAAPESKAVAVREEEPKAIVVIREELEKRSGDLLAVLPPGMDADRFKRVALLAVSKNADLLACSPGSIIRSIIEAAEIGLEPTGSLNRAWLVPFRGKDKARPDAQLMIGYQGYADLMRQTGLVTRITAEVVYEGDRFRVVKGSEDPRIEHEPAYQTEDPLKITYGYAVVWFADGTSQFEVMTRQQIEMIRAKSRQRNGPTWTQSWAQMARKSLIRRIANYVPLSTKAIEAITRDDEREFGGAAPEVLVSRAVRVRERLAARKAPQLAPGAPETAPAPGVAQEPPPAPPESAAQQTGLCEAVSPMEDPCVLPAGHEGPHHAKDDEVVWPVGEA